MREISKASGGYSIHVQTCINSLQPFKMYRRKGTNTIYRTTLISDLIDITNHTDLS